MSTISKKTLAASVGALAIAASFAVTATPAAAGWHGHHGYGGGLAVGLLGAAIVGGAIAASQPAYAAPVYGGCELRRQPVYNRFGDVIGFRRVRVCF
ncbi:hypothetical protein PY365_08980 [Roseiarcaceae bacterium H3SJ34-1]|uniref:hypothetical protein n=1 Tax=Terripilifer ovatus TaxID=3032367 RepID=UPI003AB99042|nr:hypothetical protein [Roseiarcaceae bacterium H3SJ34-1]